MKRILVLLMVLVISLTMFAGCVDDSPTPKSEQIEEVYAKFRVLSEEQVATSTYIFIIEDKETCVHYILTKYMGETVQVIPRIGYDEPEDSGF